MNIYRCSIGEWWDGVRRELARCRVKEGDNYGLCSTLSSGYLWSLLVLTELVQFNLYVSVRVRPTRMPCSAGACQRCGGLASRRRIRRYRTSTAHHSLNISSLPYGLFTLYTALATIHPSLSHRRPPSCPCCRFVGCSRSSSFPMSSPSAPRSQQLYNVFRNTLWFHILRRLFTLLELCCSSSTLYVSRPMATRDVLRSGLDIGVPEF